ncbi:Rrf2 family transcriptional regulator [Salimicrobium jeotgali]|uniref:HTH-type transcriptional regulator NsrR n=1 Tax=Salimicrobium jeotgali TaxID=1230341 RepID=K2FPQ5_9BACI|nr:Rrf2 family transcriptional regulator [Salimicrobium jeotgali]AKG03838.1 Rrf2 family transcriptional regulator [Salimicrobium jeotgali]EKE32861.1 transcription regulator NsrR [Salimicrobium jeotgali]MBM7695146.1 Rrf2 family nitric oxide-sensitive transcriptional repressor [Salimicrobium jeotgali]
MRLKKYTDYALRVLMFTAVKEDGELASKKEISAAFGISMNHLAKIVHELQKSGYVETVRGRNGGIRLARPPEDINVGAVVRVMEDDFNLFECFSCDTDYCVISPVCKLKSITGRALREFLRVLDAYTLADIVENRQQLEEFLN